MESPQTISFKRRKLSHWMVEGRPYFVTFRLKNSLPAHIIEELKIQKAEFIATNASKDMIDYQRYEFKKVESLLDAVKNEPQTNFLAQPEIAKLIVDAFAFIERKYSWRFPAFVVMPNHVHCLGVYQDLGDKRTLIETIGYLKSFVGRSGNKLLGRNGTLWADENFDHWCRTPEKVESVIQYIVNNPVKARLVGKPEEWPWTKCPK